MKKILSMGIIIAIIATMLTSFCVKAEETQESVNPNIIYAYYDYSDELNYDTIDMSKMIVVDHSIYYLENNEYTCIEFFNTEDYAINATEITVKDYINGIPVTRVNGAQVKYINKKCYSKLTKVNIPNTVKTIGKRAFCKLKNLTELTLPKSLTKIEEYAFSGLKKITKKLENINQKLKELDDRINILENYNCERYSGNWIKFFGIYNNSNYIFIYIFFIKFTIKINEKNINKLAWWIPIRKWRDNFRNKFFK